MPSDHGGLSLRPLPALVTELLARYPALPALEAHLRLVHDVAVELTAALTAQGLGAPIDADAVAFGAATHDIGKLLYPQELTGPGNRHEDAGRSLLLEAGIEQRLARFACTHNARRHDTNTTLEDCLVALADTCWKGHRDSTLESRVAEKLSVATSRDYWHVWLTVDNLVGFTPVYTDGLERVENFKSCTATRRLIRGLWNRSI